MSEYQTLPDTAYYRAMATGHRIRTAHDLRAHLEVDADGIATIVRECCQSIETPVRFA